MKSLLFIGLFLLSGSALSYERCKTTSSGYEFPSEGHNRARVIQDAINSCTSSRYTTNSECRANVKCVKRGRYEFAGPRCKTTSSGYKFLGGGTSLSRAKSDAINSCTSSRYTNNSECRAKVQCMRPGGRFTEANYSCKTNSSGYTFLGGADNKASAKADAINSCTSSRYTNNSQCRANVQCKRPGGAFTSANLKCETNSSGYSFTGGGESISIASQDALSACTSSRYTNNGQCRANLRCTRSNGSVQYLNKVCQASSSGYEFISGASSFSKAKNEAIQSCKSSRYTNNGQCDADVKCREGGSNRWFKPHYSCTSRSNGYSFQGGDVNKKTAVRNAIKSCQSSRYTNNDQCRRAVSCIAPTGHAGSDVSTPVTPVNPSRPSFRSKFMKQGLVFGHAIKELSEELEDRMPYSQYSQAFYPFVEQANRLIARIKNKNENKILRNTLKYMIGLVDKAQVVVDNELPHQDLRKFLRYVKRESRRLMDLLAGDDRDPIRPPVLGGSSIYVVTEDDVDDEDPSIIEIPVPRPRPVEPPVEEEEEPIVDDIDEDEDDVLTTPVPGQSISDEAKDGIDNLLDMVRDLSAEFNGSMSFDQFQDLLLPLSQQSSRIKRAVRRNESGAKVAALIEDLKAKTDVAARKANSGHQFSSLRTPLARVKKYASAVISKL
jgi:hypothetical protein